MFEEVEYWVEEVPKVFGLYHIIWLIILVVSIILLCRYVKGNNEKTLRKMLLIFGMLMIILEIYKQLTLAFKYNSETDSINYAWYLFPFQFCSTPMYIALVSGFLKEGKIRDLLLSYLTCYSIFGGLTVMIYPEQVFIGRVMINFQSMFHHSSQIVLGVWLLYSGHVKANYKTVLKGAIPFLVLLAMAFLMNLGFVHFKISSNDVFNMFYIGPHFECTLPLVSMFYPKIVTVLNYIPFLLLYIFGFIGAAGVVLLIYYGIYKLIENIKSMINNKNKKVAFL